MNGDNPWQDPEFAKQYATAAGDRNRGWHEFEVNLPSLAGLIPKGTDRLLDFGCGPGDMTALLTQYSKSVEGCDNSQAMIDIAHKKYPQIPFFLWDFHNKLPAGHKPFDAVISKLTLHFIEDLDLFAAAIRKILTPSGYLIFSVPHPAYTAKQVADYWEQAEYRMQISKYGMYDTMIHRSLEVYMSPFLKQGFALTGLAEPKAKKATIKAHGADPSEFILPKRLNLRFQKCITK
jgi:SAM-dependent methyltransferase